MDRSIIDDSRDVGMAILYERELAGQTLNFRLDETGNFVDEETGSRWNIFGEAGRWRAGGGNACGNGLRRRISGSPGRPSSRIPGYIRRRPQNERRAAGRFAGARRAMLRFDREHPRDVHW